METMGKIFMHMAKPSKEGEEVITTEPVLGVEIPSQDEFDLYTTIWEPPEK